MGAADGLGAGGPGCLTRSRAPSDLALNWAPDFPAETAKEAVAILARESSQRHHHVWCVLDALVARVPKWAQSERQSAP